MFDKLRERARSVMGKPERLSGQWLTHAEHHDPEVKPLTLVQIHELMPPPRPDFDGLVVGDTMFPRAYVKTRTGANRPVMTFEGYPELIPLGAWRVWRFLTRCPENMGTRKLPTVTVGEAERSTNTAATMSYRGLPAAEPQPAATPEEGAE